MMSLGQSFMFGVRRCGGFFISTFLFGLMFGLAASAAGLEAWHGLLMSATVFSASAQFATLEFWQAPLPLTTIALSVVLVSTRNILLGMSVATHFDGYSIGRRLLHLSLLNDPAVVTIFSLGPKVNRLGYLTGYGVMLWLSWLISTALGFAIADMVGAGIAASFGFAGPLVMAIMMVLFIQGTRTRHTPWIVSGLMALLLTELDVSNFLILPIAVLAGVIAGVMQYRFDQPAGSAGSSS